MFPTDAITAASGGANATVLFYSARTFFFFVPVARFTLSGFRLFRRRWIARQLPIRIIWQKVPRTSFQTSLSLSLSRALKRTYTHNRVPFTPASPPIFLSLPFRTLFLVPRLFGFGPSRHPGLLRSPTNLFDKSFRLIGRTTRPRSFF